MTSEELRTHLWIMCLYLKDIKEDPANAVENVDEFLRNSDGVPFVIYRLFFRRTRELLAEAGMLTQDMRSTLERLGAAKGPATAEALQRQLAEEDRELAELSRLKAKYDAQP